MGTVGCCWKEVTLAALRSQAGAPCAQSMRAGTGSTAHCSQKLGPTRCLTRAGQGAGWPQDGLCGGVKHERVVQHGWTLEASR